MFVVIKLIKKYVCDLELACEIISKNVKFLFSPLGFKGCSYFLLLKIWCKNNLCFCSKTCITDRGFYQHLWVRTSLYFKCFWVKVGIILSSVGHSEALSVSWLEKVEREINNQNEDIHTSAGSCCWPFGQGSFVFVLTSVLLFGVIEHCWCHRAAALSMTQCLCGV